MSEQLSQMQEMLKKSLITIKKLEAELELSKNNNTNTPIAIVGVGLRLPGNIHSTKQLWDLLTTKKDVVTEIPKTRWDNDLIYDIDPLKPGKTNAKHGAFLTDDPGEWDAPFFGITPREAKSLDPLQRIIFEVTLEALESAGISPDELKGSKTGVYMALGNSDYMSARLRSGNLSDIDVYDATGIPFSTAAGRLSYLYDLRGPNFALDAACASSLVGLHLAAEDLKTKRSDCAIVASANLILSPELYVGLAKLGSLSTNGICKAFDENADGYVRGEGCGIVILKRLEDAIKNNDNVLAIIKGSAIKHDGTSNGFTAPNPEAQLAVIKEALSNSGLNAEDISFVEAHGIGNKFTDAMEIQAIDEAYKNRQSPLYIGSLKPNIGHLEATIGMGMLFKTIESLKHHQVAPNIHIETLNKDIDWQNIKSKIPLDTIDVSIAENATMKTAINLSGYSGTNVHMIFEEGIKQKSNKPKPNFTENVFQLSAKSPESLKAIAEKYVAQFDNWANLRLHDICYTLQVGRGNYEYKLTINAISTEQIKTSLENFIDNKPDKSLKINDSEINSSKNIAFLYSGQGAQYFGMCKSFYDTNLVFKNTFDNCNELLLPFLDLPIKEIIFGENNDNNLINQTQYTQPALFVIEYSLTKMWQSWGIEPYALAGHSVGEFVALTISGAIELKDALNLIALRGKLMQSLPTDNGAMAAVIAGKETITPFLSPFKDKICIAAYNSPKSTTISGEKDAINQLLEVLKESKIKAIPLVVSHAFHSHLMDPIVGDFEKEVAKIAFKSPQIPVISNVTGKELAFEDLTPSYFGKHLRGTVHFYDDMIYLSEQLGVDVYLELGPNPTLIGLGKQGIEKNTAVWLSSAKKGSEDWEQIFNSLSLLFLSNVPFKWKQFYAAFDLLKVNLPTYAWQKKKYWYNPVRIGQDNAPLTQKESIVVDNQPIETKSNGDNLGLTKETFYHIMHKEGNRILGLEKGSKLDDHRSMRDQGFDSMMSGEYLTALEKYLNTTLDISLLHLYTNLHDLHDYLSKKYLTNTQGGVLMNDIILGNILEEEEESGNWHEIKETDGWILRTFKKIDAKLPTISK